MGNTASAMGNTVSALACPGWCTGTPINLEPINVSQTSVSTSYYRDVCPLCKMKFQHKLDIDAFNIMEKKKADWIKRIENINIKRQNGEKEIVEEKKAANLTVIQQQARNDQQKRDDEEKYRKTEHERDQKKRDDVEKQKKAEYERKMKEKKAEHDMKMEEKKAENDRAKDDYEREKDIHGRKMNAKKEDDEREMKKMDRKARLEELKLKRVNAMKEIYRMMISNRDMVQPIQEVGRLLLGDDMENAYEDNIGHQNSVTNRNHRVMVS